MALAEGEGMGKLLKWSYGAASQDFLLSLLDLAISILDKLVVGCLLAAMFRQGDSAISWAIVLIVTCVFLVASRSYFRRKK